jgi:restriction endonuclease S subunit
MIHDHQKQKMIQEIVSHLFDFLSNRNIEELEKTFKDHPLVEVIRIQKKKRYLALIDTGEKQKQ